MSLARNYTRRSRNALLDVQSGHLRQGVPDILWTTRFLVDCAPFSNVYADFFWFDRDFDGQVTQQELDAHFNREHPTMGAASAGDEGTPAVQRQITSRADHITD